MPRKPRHIPVSTLARFAADPEAFSKPRTRSMGRAAAHGVRWHESLAGGRAGMTPGKRLAIAATVFLAVAAAAWLLLAP